MSAPLPPTTGPGRLALSLSVNRAGLDGSSGELLASELVRKAYLGI